VVVVFLVVVIMVMFVVVDYTVAVLIVSGISGSGCDFLVFCSRGCCSLCS
jgi:hypothetical protein